jgi:UDP-N-acetyl-D-mannosaminuronic acid dehydrogenase
MVAAARHLNETVPIEVGKQVLATLHELGRDPAQARICISGFAYKGQPETDDIRGSAVLPILAQLRQYGPHLLGHDFVVAPDRIAALGVEPVSLEAGLCDADAVLILNNHRQYHAQDVHDLIARMRHPAVMFDVWGVFRERIQSDASIRYMRLACMSTFSSQADQASSACTSPERLSHVVGV